MRLRAAACVLMTLSAVCREACAQHLFEVRGADTKYRYFDWSYTTRTSAMVDVFYIGVPGSNELNLGGGYAWRPLPSVTLAPLAYAVIGREADQRGVKLALLLSVDHAGWKANAFLAHYAPVHGSVARYQVLDTFDLTRTVRRRWDLGLSAGFFHAEDAWNPQIGPLVKLNDRFGAWGLSYRFGPQRELRVTRTVLIGK